MLWIFKKRSRRRRRGDKTLYRINGIPVRAIFECTFLLCFVIGFIFLVSVGVKRLDAHVKQDLFTESPEATIVFDDLPSSIELLALNDLYASIDDLLRQPWIHESICEELARRLSQVGWVDHLYYVRRTSDGQFHVSARYREPVAMIQHSGMFLLVDKNTIRLPGEYPYDPSWRLIQGVLIPAPKSGSAWGGEDIKAGLAVWSRIGRETFAMHITSVSVKNYAGRSNPRASHIELVTDRAGGRIRWGSPPGLELEENTLTQKLAILRANYAQTGRADAHHDIIDISIYNDRYTVPG